MDQSTLDSLLDQAKAAFSKAGSASELESVKAQYLGKKAR